MNRFGTFPQVVIEDVAGLKSILGRQSKQSMQGEDDSIRELIAQAMDADNPLAQHIASCLGVSQ